ncbi:MAG: plastocyanin [Litorivivens sp.]|jgi:plastocyanin
MKLNFTLSLFAMLFVSAFATSQTTHEVDCSGLSFTPAMLTIVQGDIVNWTNTGGTHNVNASTEIFADNPESFGNALSEDWTFEHTFTIPGTYVYRCDAHFQSGMVGTITVEAATTVDENTAVEVSVNVYPQPAADFVVFNVQNAGSNMVMSIHDLTGRSVAQSFVSSGTELKIATADWTNGIYVYRLKSNDILLASGTLMIK